MSQYKVCGYDMEVLHARQLELAAELDRICRQEGIKYSLYGGSVIGAVRHNGFIPWDHDIDIAMPRKDYQKFIKYCKKHPSEKFFFSTYKSEKKYPNNWELHLLAGIVYCSMEKYEKAVEYFEKAGEIGTPFCDEKYRIAWCYQKLEKFKDAYQIYLEIADIHRKNGYDVEAEQALGYAKEIEDKIKQ